MLDQPACSSWLSLRHQALLLLFGAALLLPFLGSMSISYHEMIFARPALEMIETGDWLLPRCAGIPCNHKPPLTHWSIAACMSLFGNPAEWVARLPSVVAALWTAWLVAGLAARWLSKRLGLLAGAMQLTTYCFVRHGRLAEADMLLTATVSTALAAFALAHIDSPAGRLRARWLPWAFYFAAGLAFLVKGPIGPVLIFAGCGAFVVLQRQFDAWRFFASPIGLVIFALTVIPWPWMAYHANPAIWKDWTLHNVGRFQGELNGQKHPLYYVYSLPAFALPWSLLWIPGAIRTRRGTSSSDPSAGGLAALGRFIACCVIPGLILLSLSAFKRKHYALPLLPLMTLLSAAGVSQCAAWVTEWLPSRRTLQVGWAIAFAAAWLIVAALNGCYVPPRDSFRAQTELAGRVNACVPASEPLYLVHMPENQITFYLRRPLVRHDKIKQFADHMAATHTHSAYLLVPEEVLERIEPLGRLQTLDQCEGDEAFQDRDAPRLTLVRLTAGPDPAAVGAN